MSGDDGRPPRARPRMDRAVMASNWRQVLAVDIAMGAAVTLTGLFVALFWAPAVGALLAAVGATYVVLGVLRWRRWALLRRAAGLDGPEEEAGPADWAEPEV